MIEFFKYEKTVLGSIHFTISRIDVISKAMLESPHLLCSTRTSDVQKEYFKEFNVVEKNTRNCIRNYLNQTESQTLELKQIFEEKKKKKTSSLSFELMTLNLDFGDFY